VASGNVKLNGKFVRLYILGFMYYFQERWSIVPIYCSICRNV
jgi:hypothetical protein